MPTLRAEQATAEAFLDGISGAQLVHVAAHGRHQRENPLFSSIRLADGPVVGYDLDRVPDPPQQVVLSACDLGQATVRPGRRGARADPGVPAQRHVDGDLRGGQGVGPGAADLMADYHRRLAGGAAPGVRAGRCPGRRRRADAVRLLRRRLVDAPVAGTYVT